MTTPMFPYALYKHKGLAADQDLTLSEWNQVGIEVQSLEDILNQALGNPANDPGQITSSQWSLTVPTLTWGKQTMKGRLLDVNDTGDLQIRSNWRGDASRDDNSRAGWALRMGSLVDEFSLNRVDTAGVSKQMHQLSNVGDAYFLRYLKNLSQWTWMTGPADTYTGTGVHSVVLTTATPPADPGGLAQPFWSQIWAPSDSMILLGASVTISGGIGTLYIRQFDGSAWHNRAGMTHAAAAATGIVYNVFAMCDTHKGIKFDLMYNSGTATAIVSADDASPMFWGIVLGRSVP